MRTGRIAVGFGLLAALVVPSAAAANPSDYLAATTDRLSGTTIQLKDSEPEILSRVFVSGAIPVASPHQWVTVTLRRGGRVVTTRRVPVDPHTGRYRTRIRLKGCCEYVVQATHNSDASDALGFEVSGPPVLEDGTKETLLFNRLLEDAGYHMGDVTDSYDASSALAVMALRKVHDLERTEEYSPRLFELLLRGDAEFEPVNTEGGRHVEVDVSRQVMALVEDGKATDVFHVSTGSGGTPRGEWTFYQQSPGYNAKGMYYSSYYDGNYATHGYSSVPTYPASHGCTRNPIPYSVFIYEWIEIGMKIYVYD
jgi:hypothetical protein